MERITSFTIDHDVLVRAFTFPEKMEILQPMILEREDRTKEII